MTTIEFRNSQQEASYSKPLGTKGKKHLQFDSPDGIAFNTSNNKVYVADTYNHRIQVLNSDLTFFSTIRRTGHGKGEFSCPGSM